ncbi:jg20999 [Pararge aegeria aegeria]|uniref:Jg20999 protein n=1 Tax=Pararge aegeria aegeria TaxID=348720 RepID=A0A8S4R710_9NEOP|nr:jg20999 [Pararge aegeria aegeria]
MTRGVRRGCVRLRAAVIGIDDEDDSTFTITVDHKTFHFQARDGSERERWVRALEDTIVRHGRRERWSRCVPAPAHRHGDLERRISEADAYLQIMIELVSKMTTRVSELAEPQDKNKGQVILDHSNVMLDNIKHSIVLLQIAKNTVNPVNGVYQGPTTLSQSHIKEDLSSRVELGSECRELSTPTHPITPLEHIDAPRQAMTLLVPDTSYSSSEGEDDFYDADDELVDTVTPGPRLGLIRRLRVTQRMMERAVSGVLRDLIRSRKFHKYSSNAVACTGFLTRICMKKEDAIKWNNPWRL